MAVGDFLPPVVTRLTANIDDIMAKVETAKAAIKSIGDTTAKISFDANTKGLLASAAAAKALSVATKGTATAASSSIPIWHRWLDLIHFGFAAFGENIAADAIGIAAFALGAVSNFGPVAEAIGNMGKTYLYLNNQQKGAANSLQTFISKFEGASNTGMFAIFYQLLDTVGNKLGMTGGITAQATQAFEYFAAVLRNDFSSQQWAAVIGRSSTLIRTDLTALFNLLSSFIQLIPGLLHDFNFLGLYIMNSVGFVFRALSSLSEASPIFTRFAYGAYLVSRAWRYLWTGMGAGAGPIQRMYLAIRNLFTAVTAGSAATGAARDMKILGVNVAGVAANFKQFGFLPTVSMALGGVGIAAAATAAGLGLLTGVLLASFTPWGDYQTAADLTISKVNALDNANQNSIGAWQNGLDMLRKAKAALPPLSAGIDTVTRGTKTWSLQQVHLNDQIQYQTQKISTLRANLSYLGQTYGLNTAQAYQLAKVTGVSLSKAFGPTSRSEIQAYVQAVNAAKNPLTAVQYGMQQAANTALQLDDRVTGLTNAFNALLTPFANVIQDTVTWKDGNIALKSAVRSSGDQVGYATGKQRIAAAALATSITNTVNLSEAILTQTGNVQKAQGPIRGLIGVLTSLHSHSRLVTQAIGELEQYLNRLHSKTINIGVNISTYGATQALNQVLGGGGVGHPVMPGHASGTASAQPGWAMVGERGPELMYFKGGEKVVPNSQLNGYADGAGGVMGEVHVYLDGVEIFSKVKKSTWQYNTRNGNRGKGGKVSGTMVPR